MGKFGHLFIQPRDFERSFFFFTEILGWKATKRFGKSADASRLAYICSDAGFRIVLAEDHDKSDPATKPEIYKDRGRVVLHLDVDDVDISFAEIKDGTHVILRPENNHWGSRWFVVEDPDGNQFAWQSPVKK